MISKLGKFLTKIFGNKNEREAKKIMPIVLEINSIYEELHTLSDVQLRSKTDEFKKQINDTTKEYNDEIDRLKEELCSNEDVDREAYYDAIADLEEAERKAREEILEEILPEAFAVVKETCKRLCGTEIEVTGQKIIWNMIPYDVQLLGAIALHRGIITEMATGEGKTLVATMPVYLNALTGKGVHLITVNDYLASRDAEWMKHIYNFLGLEVQCLQNDIEDPIDRQKIYNADITYGTNSEFGFDYLRDNMKSSLEDRVQSGHHYAIIDEVDSILIDEARTPLIISGMVSGAGETSKLYISLKGGIQSLVRKQMHLVNKLINDAKKLMELDDEDKNKDWFEIGTLLLRAQHGSPKNKQLLKLYADASIKKLVIEVEENYMQEKNKLNEINETLYYYVDERGHNIELSDMGRGELSKDNPDMFILPDLSTGFQEIDEDETLSKEEKLNKREEFARNYALISERLHALRQMLKANVLFEKDIEYVLQDGKVLIVDEYTGRILPGRRYSDGLHQAIEAKEGVTIEKETQTLATITIQNYFRMYEKLAGMTGTAETEASEFWDIYKLDVLVIPTNEPIRRLDYDDLVFQTLREKYNAVIEEIISKHNEGQPVLVLTVSVEVSEKLSRMLKRHKIPHEVLNARQHQREAEIVSKAGQKGAITIATNMAGRGTDIKLGEGVINPDCIVDGERYCCLICPFDKKICDNGCPKSTGEMKECLIESPCGLHIIGTERHESRRIDRQLRGRAGRQGDPGSSRFFIALEDDLMRLFGGDRITSVLNKLGGIPEGEVIRHPLISRTIQNAQKKVEANNFSIRKHLLEYDNVMNQQREVIYDRRLHALEGENLKNDILEAMETAIADIVDKYTLSKYPEEWEWDALIMELQRRFLSSFNFAEEQQDHHITRADLTDIIYEQAIKIYELKSEAFDRKYGKNAWRDIEQKVTLYVIDEKWKDHLYIMDQLKSGIGLRAYAQKDPLVEYKKEGYEQFKSLLQEIDNGIIEYLLRVRIEVQDDYEKKNKKTYQPTSMNYNSAQQRGYGVRGGGKEITSDIQKEAAKKQKLKPIRRQHPKIGRNDPCPCGSGKKYKKCCGRNK